MSAIESATGNAKYAVNGGTGRSRYLSILYGRNLLRLSETGLNNWIFFGIILLYHVSLIFQGIDLLDEGFHVVFYQRIFNDPSSVEYSFFYWFSGIMGGAVLKIIPGLGLVGLRLAGSLVSVSTIFIVFRMLRDYIPRGILQLSIIILSLYINTEPKDIHYNTISALIYFIAASFMFRGLAFEKRLFILVSGAFVCLNFFTRFPNILGVGLVLAIFYDGIIRKKSLQNWILNTGYFIAGFVLAFFAIIGIMYMVGHLDLYINSIKFLFHLTTTTNTLDGNSGSYSMARLFYIPFKQHAISIFLMVIIVGLLIVFKGVSESLRKHNHKKYKVAEILMAVVTAIILFLIFIDKIRLEDLTYLFTGLCITTSLMYLSGNYKYEIKLLSFIGLFVMMVHPLGSAPGIMSVMIYSMWINFPLALSMLKTKFSRDMELSCIIQGQPEMQIKFEHLFMKKVFLWFVGLVLLICVRHIMVIPYFYDRHMRTDMVYGIRNPNMKFIYTSRPRADKLNDLLAESSKYIKKGDPVLAFDAMPMFHFMTETKPFLRNSAPIFYTISQFKEELHAAVDSFGLPVIVQQNIWTQHEGSGWPEEVMEPDYLQGFRNRDRNKVFYDFKVDNNYHEVWTNGIFSILIPTKKL